MREKKIVSMLLAFVMMFSMFGISAHAETVSDYYDSLEGDTGVVKSYENHQLIRITSSYSSPSTGSVGVYFFKTNVGMDPSFVKSTDRTGTIILMEQDGIFNDDDLVAEYTGYFSVKDGRYRMNTYGRTEVTGAPYNIEDASGLELYITVKINAISGDGSNDVPNGLFRYNVWAY